MKLVSFAVLLMAAIAFAVAGCSDNSMVPVSPTDQSVQAPASLAKQVGYTFKAVMGPDLIPPADYVIDAGNTNYPAKYGEDSELKTTTRGFVVRSLWNVTAWDPPAPGVDLLSGTGVLEMNFNVDYVTGKGQTWGKLTVDPYNDDGVWELSWVAPATLDPTKGWVCPLKGVGQGKGGAVDGMHLFHEGTIVLWALDGWVCYSSGSIR
jgi:hypothetical protein